MRQDRAGQRAGRIPNNVVDVGHSRRQEVLPGLDGAREGQTEQDREDVRLHGRAVDRAERDEHQESPRHEQQDVRDQRDDDQREHARRHRPVRHTMRQMAQTLERNRIDLRVALPRHPQRHARDGNGRDQEQQNRERPADDDRRLHQTLTNFLKSTFRISPTAIKNIMVADPPYEISGSGIPVTGRSPICMPTLMTTWKMKNAIRVSTRNVPPRSRADFATASDSRTRNRYNVNTTLTPTEPHSSPRTEKMKSVCRAGRYSRLTCVPCRNPLPVMPPDPLAIFACIT